MKYGMCLFFGLLFSVSVVADNSPRKSVEELLQVMKMDSTLDSTYAQMDQLFASMGKQFGLKPSEQATYDKHMQKMQSVMKEIMNGQKVREAMIGLYLKHYSEQEITDMLAFYKSESGRSMVDKMPLILADSMALSQQMMQAFLPRMQELMAEFQEEITVLRTK